MNLIQNRPPQLQPVFRSLMKMENQSKQAIAVLEVSTKSSFNLIWNNPDATPAEMLAAMGTNAISGFTAHHAAVLALRAAGKNTSTYDTPPLEYTAHPDGSITLN